MCVVSMVADHYWKKWEPTWPRIPVDNEYVPLAPWDLQEFERLKREVEDMKKLLERAKEYDLRTGQPDCEKPELMDALRKIAAAVGVKLED